MLEILRVVNAPYRSRTAATGTGQPKRIAHKRKMYFVYVLQSVTDERLYIGFTNNIEKRFRDHNSGKNLSTQSRRPFNLIYYEAHLVKEDALRRERYFKTTKGKTTLRQMLRQYFVNRIAFGPAKGADLAP